jgi:hypothetical protein
MDLKTSATGHVTPNLCVSHPVGSVGHIVHSGVFRVQNINTLFSCLGGAGTDLTKSTAGHVMPTLCFCIWWDLRVT